MRNYLQLAFFTLTNGYFAGFLQGKIYQGKGKQLCFPGLNCYSCPGALGACPVGAVQAMLTGANKSIPYYALGFLLFFAVLLGRGVCALLCPFGLVQDLLHKCQGKQPKIQISLPKICRKLPYVILLVFVLGLPLFLTNQFNMSDPAFCKWICPSGTLFGGIPLLSTSESLQNNIGGLFYWKLSLLLLILLWSVLEYRPFCKYFCPLGAFYGLFQSVSLFHIKYDTEQCIRCNACIKSCKMGVNVTKTPNSPDCVRCGDCVKVCPTTALSFSPGVKCPKTAKKKHYSP